ncbi:MAG: hypothetical protein WD423_10185 [Rhodothermales bacterium]
MTEIGPLDKARDILLADIRALLEKLRAHVEVEPASVHEAVDLLFAVRSDVYEDINQLQHEHLILKAADWLVGQAELSEDVM